MSKYVIEARSMVVKNTFGIGRHNYWVMREEGTKGSDGVVAELHGMAYNRNTKEYVTIGTSEKVHSLGGLHIVHGYTYAKQVPKHLIDKTPQERRIHSLIADNQKSQVVFTGSFEDVKKRWAQAIMGSKELSNKDLNYPLLGIQGKPEQLVNSNSAYATFAELMGVKIQRFPGYEPGIKNRVLSPERIDQLKYRPQQSINQKNIHSSVDPIAYNSLTHHEKQNIAPGELWKKLGFSPKTDVKSQVYNFENTKGNIKQIAMYSSDSVKALNTADRRDPTQVLNDYYQQIAKNPEKNTSKPKRQDQGVDYV